MNDKLELKKVADALRVDLNAMDDGSTGALALVRATGELLKHCPDASDESRPFEALVRWTQVLIPDAGPRDARRVADTSHPTKNPDWLAALHFGKTLETSVPPLLFLSGLIYALPQGQAQTDAAWEYARSAGRNVGLDDSHFDALRGWLDGAAAPTIDEWSQQTLEALSQKSKTSAAVAALILEKARAAKGRVPRVSAPAFLDARTQALSHVGVILQHAEALQISTPELKNLQKSIESDHFRVAVLGEFNRGKSTLLNALLEAPGLMPSSIRPSTSALTQIRYASERSFYVRDPDTGALKTRDEAAFRADVAQADKIIHDVAGADTAAKKVPRWTVGLPSPFLAEALVELVDSPGLNEDPVRDAMSRSEALRADAALIVFNIGQLVAKDEVALILSMQSQLNNVIVVVNKADQEPEATWPELKEYVVSRLEARRCPIPPERIAFVSARNALRALEEGRFSDPDLERIRALRGLVSSHLVARSGPLKAERLVKSINKVVKAGRAEVRGTLEHRKAQLAELQSVESNYARAAQYAHAAEAEIARGARALSKHDEIAARLWSRFEASLPAILADFEQTKPKWETDANPLFAPKQCVEDIGAKAVKHLKYEVTHWMEGEGAKVLDGALEQHLSTVTKQVPHLEAFLRAVRGEGAQSEDAFQSNLRERVLRDAFDGLSGVTGEVDAFAPAAALAVGALVAGYVVADVVLFYVLSAITGFLALPLLVAAVVFGLVIGVSVGPDAARNLVRNRVFEQTAKSMQNPESLAKMRDGFDRAIAQVTERLSHGFERVCTEMLAEARAEARKTHDVLQKLAQDSGDRASVEAEVARLESLAQATLQAYEGLARVGASLEQAPA